MLIHLGRGLSPTAGVPWFRGYKADNIDPSLILDLKNSRFAANNTPRAFTDIFTLTRATSKWVFNSSGVLTEVAANQPAYDYNPATGAARGILIETQRTNLILNSATGTNQSVTTTATTYTLSFFGTGTVTLSGTYSGVLVGSGAYPTRSTLTFTATAGTLNVTVSGTVGYIQIEAGAYATSYIPTTGAAQTRAADVCVNSSSNAVPTTGWYNATGEGTFLIKWELAAVPTASQRVAINVFRNSAQWDYRVYVETQGSSGVGYTVREAATTVAQIATATAAPVACSDAFAIKTNDFALYRNGASVGVDTVGNAPTGIDRFYLGSVNISGQFDGWIKEVLYYPQRISNSELVRITS